MFGKYYKVNLYKHSFDKNDYLFGNDLETDEVVSTIIVKKGIMSAKEILSNISFDIVGFDGVVISYFYTKKGDYKKENIASSEEINDYVDNFDSENFVSSLTDVFNKKEEKKYVKVKEEGRINGLKTS